MADILAFVETLAEFVLVLVMFDEMSVEVIIKFPPLLLFRV